MKVHLVGIGGTGMSGLARLLLARGDEVTGSDLRPANIPGARLSIGHAAANLPAAVDLVVRSAAVPEDNPELAEARRRGIRILKYAEMLGELSRTRTTIAVAGCHGKTTTTAMVAYILSRAGFEPAFVCGGVIPQLGSNASPGGGRHMVVEACEYDRSFLNLSPACAVITNIEEDHLDYYKDLSEIVGAFREFAARTAGPVIASADSPPAASIVSELQGRGEAFSIRKDADWRARNLEVKGGRWSFEVLKYGRPFGLYTLGIPGEHNVANALAAVAAATWAGVGQEIIQVALLEFAGAARRFQVLGERDGALVVDDYAHHPTEVQATLRACRARYPGRRIWCVFQPHQHSRTRHFLRDFARSFQDADVVLLPEIYAARDLSAERKRISSADLAKALAEQGRAALFLPTFEEILTFLRQKVQPDCLILTMGAGNVDEIARRFLAG